MTSSKEGGGGGVVVGGGAVVYIQDDIYGWIPGTVRSSTNETAIVTALVPSKKGAEEEERTVKLADYDANTLPLQNVDEDGKLIEKEDMRDLPSLHEAAILYNLKARHEKTKPYTRVGDIVIAMNPFQWINDLYAEDKKSLYINRLIFDSAEGLGGPDAIRKNLEPHVYESSALAYRGLAVDGQHQSILVSGESGAGKTETVKIVMSHLASVRSAKPDADDDDDDDGMENNNEAIVRRVLESNVLLEAFGNAKTQRNNNSSRFGKYIQLQFDVEDKTSASLSGKSTPYCIIAGSTSETYLLEKTRVVGHDDHERTYHIFYQLLASPDTTKAQYWDHLQGKDTTSFAYIGAESETLLLDGMTDAQKFEETVQTLASAGISGDLLRTLMRAVCTVLQLGNITFQPDPSDDSASVLADQAEVDALLSILGGDIQQNDIAGALTTKLLTVGRESYTSPLRHTEARDVRDAFAKEIYTRIFDWLVGAINESTSAETHYPDANLVQEYGIIGLLDIFGFESFHVNRFEQLCINYANEKLQQMYTLDIFRSVQEEYEFEGIALDSISFDDNADTLNLIEGRVGLIAVLNEECVRPQGNDASFVSKVAAVNKDVSAFVRERLFRPTEFAIEHYAAKVKYDSTQFIEKNKDALPTTLVDLACRSDNGLIKTEIKAAADEKAAASSSSPSSSPGGGGRRRGKKKAALTVVTKFRAQLTSLMNHIGRTKTRYIRCIKPNQAKVPIQMDLKSSSEQLRCAGVVAAVTISRAAFPNRLMLDDALERFDLLYLGGSSKLRMSVTNDNDDDDGILRSMVDALVTHILIDYPEAKEGNDDDDGNEKSILYACGKTKIFFRAGVLEYMETMRVRAFSSKAILIQRSIRGYIARSKYLRLRKAVIKLQALARGYIAKTKFHHKKEACTKIANWWRIRLAQKELQRRRCEKAATLIQLSWRIHRDRSYFLAQRKAAIFVQKTMRLAIQRTIFKKVLERAKADEARKKRLAALKKSVTKRQSILMAVSQRSRTTADSSEGSIPQIEEDNEVSTVASIDEAAENIIDESAQLLEELRKELAEARKENDVLTKKLSEQKEETHRLKTQNANMEASFEALKQSHSRLVQKSSQKDMDLEKTKKELHKTKFKQNAKVILIQNQLTTKQIKHNMEINTLKEQVDLLKQQQKQQQQQYHQKQNQQHQHHQQQQRQQQWEAMPKERAARRDTFTRAKFKTEDESMNKFEIFDEETRQMAAEQFRQVKKKAKKIYKGALKRFGGGGHREKE